MVEIAESMEELKGYKNVRHNDKLENENFLQKRRVNADSWNESQNIAENPEIWNGFCLKKLKAEMHCTELLKNLT